MRAGGSSWQYRSVNVFDSTPIPVAQTRYDERLRRALYASRHAGIARLESLTREQAVTQVVDEHAAKPVALHPDTLRIDDREPVDFGASDVAAVPPPGFDFIIECEGTVDALTEAGEALTAVPPFAVHTVGRRSYLIVRASISDDTEEGAESNLARMGAELREAADGWVRGVADTVERVNAAIAAERQKMHHAVDEVLGVRHQRHAALKDAAAIANIPLGLVDTSNRVTVPVQPKRLRLADVEKAATVPGNDAALAEDIADDIIGMLTAFSASLERTPKTANRLVHEDEEGIRDVLLFLLNANWGGLATAESFLGEGKTDISLRWKGREAFIGECKFWKGTAKFTDGLAQLLDRYTVWRATRVAMILFIRDVTDVTAVIDKARAAIRDHTRFVAPTRSAGRDAYLMRAQYDQQQIVTLDLIPVVIPRPS